MRHSGLQGLPNLSNGGVCGAHRLGRLDLRLSGVISQGCIASGSELPRDHCRDRAGLPVAVLHYIRW